MPELQDELRQFADDAARQARPMALADVIWEADQRQRRAGAPRRQRNNRAPRRRRPGWVAPLTAAVAVIAVVAGSAAVSHAVHASGPAGSAASAGAGPADGTVYAVYGSDFRHESRLGAIIPIRNAMAGKLIRIGNTGGTAVTPDGQTFYVPDGKTIIPVPAATGQPGKPIDVGAAGSFVWITMDPNGKVAYVRGVSDIIVPINLATNKPGKPIRLSDRVDGVVFSPDGETAYALGGNGNSGLVVPISTATGALGRPIRVGGRAGDMVFGPGGKIAYVEGEAVKPGTTTSIGTFTPVNLATGTADRTTKIRCCIISVAITPDGKTVYLGTEGGGADSWVVPVSTATGKAGKLISTGGGTPGQMVITPSGKTVYVVATNYAFHGGVVPISTATNTVGKPVVTGDIPVIGLSPDGGTLYTALRVPIPDHQTQGQIEVVPVSTATSTPGRAIRIPVTVGLPVQVLTP